MNWWRFLRRCASWPERDPEAAKELPGEGVDEKGSADRAAWVMVARTMMNLDEFYTRE